MNELFAPNKEMVAKPLGHRRINEQIDKTSAAETENHTACNRQPRIKKMKLQESNRHSRSDEGVKEIDDIRSIGHKEHEPRDAS